jgi:hypothetical protein
MPVELNTKSLFFADVWLSRSRLCFRSMPGASAHTLDMMCSVFESTHCAPKPWTIVSVRELALHLNSEAPTCRRYMMGRWRVGGVPRVWVGYPYPTTTPLPPHTQPNPHTRPGICGFWGHHIQHGALELARQQSKLLDPIPNICGHRGQTSTGFASTTGIEVSVHPPLPSFSTSLWSLPRVMSLQVV